MNRPPRPRDEHSAERAQLVLEFIADSKDNPPAMADILWRFRNHPANRIRAAVQNLVNRGAIVNVNAGGPRRRGRYVVAKAAPTTPQCRSFDAGALIQAWRPQAC
jgi:hypothetical protein